MTNKNQRLKWRAEKDKVKAEALKAEAESAAKQSTETSDKPESTEPASTSTKPVTKSKSNKKKKPNKKKAKISADVPSQARALSLEYLRNWKASRETFKFQKTRQTWLVNNAFDRSKLPKSDFSSFVEYTADMQGASRQRLLEKAQALVAEYKEKKASKPAESAEKEDESAESEDPEVVKAKEFKRSYQRAKSLVEALA